MVVSDLVVLRNLVVVIVLFFLVLIGMLMKDCLKVWIIVLLGGMMGVDILVVGFELKFWELEGIEGLGR